LFFKSQICTQARLEKFKNINTRARAPELIKIIGSKDENAGIMRLPKNVQRALTRNEIIIGHKKWRQISSKARDQLQRARSPPQS